MKNFNQIQTWNFDFQVTSIDVAKNLQFEGKVFWFLTLDIFVIGTATG